MPSEFPQHQQPTAPINMEVDQSKARIPPDHDPILPSNLHIAWPNSKSVDSIHLLWTTNLTGEGRLPLAQSLQDNKDEPISTTGTNIQPRETQSFKERKEGHSWIRKFTRQMSPDYNSNGTDYSTAVAAAAYAIQSLEEQKPKDQKETAYGPDHKSLNKTTGALYEPPKSALKSPDDKTPTNKKIPEKEPHTKKRISFADNDGNNSNKPEKPAAEKAPEVSTPSTIRLPTSADKLLNKTVSKKTETSTPKPYIPTTQRLVESAESQAVAHTWEKNEMAILKGRYEKLRITIDNWETNKKKKANSKLQRTEAELDKRRAKANQAHRNEIIRIERTAGGARMQAEANQRKEESNVKKKANKIKLTGKKPATWWCF